MSTDEQAHHHLQSSGNSFVSGPHTAGAGHGATKIVDPRTRSDARKNMGQNAQAQEVAQEEGRAPYVHV